MIPKTLRDNPLLSSTPDSVNLVHYLKAMESYANQMMKPGHRHVFDVSGNVDHLALLHQVLGQHLHGHVALDHPASSHLGSIDYRVRQHGFHHIGYLEKHEISV